DDRRVRVVPGRTGSLCCFRGHGISKRHPFWNRVPTSNVPFVAEPACRPSAYLAREAYVSGVRYPECGAADGIDGGPDVPSSRIGSSLRATFQFPAAGRVAAGHTCSSTFWTLLTRSTLAGMVFTVAAEFTAMALMGSVVSIILKEDLSI